MANSYLQTAFNIRVTADEAALLQECFETSDEISIGFGSMPAEELEGAKAYYAERTEAFRKVFPESADEQDPFATFLELWDDPEFPEFDADLCISADGAGIGAIASFSGTQVDVRAVASLIQKTCSSAFPCCFQWANYTDRLRPDEHGGGFFIITATDIIGGSTRWLMQTTLQTLKSDDGQGSSPVALLKELSTIVDMIDGLPIDDDGARRVLPGMLDRARAIAALAVALPN
jgi:hypothetical protein